MQIHWTNIACTAITVACIGYGDSKAQESVHVQTRLPRPVPTEPVIVHTVIKPAETVVPMARPAPIVIKYGQGGSIAEHRQTYNGYQNSGAPVEVRGPCYSACTLVVAHINPERLCFGEGAFLAFHAAQTTMDATAQRHPHGTAMMYLTYPPPIKAWIDRHGGVDKLPGPREGFWTMYDRELWAMGYARCP